MDTAQLQNNVARGGGQTANLSKQRHMNKRPTYRNRDMGQMANLSKPRHGPNGQPLGFDTLRCEKVPKLSVSIPCAGNWCPSYRFRGVGRLAHVSVSIGWPFGPCLGFEGLAVWPMSRFRGIGRLAHASVSIGWPPAIPSLRGLGLPGASGALPEASGTDDKPKKKP